ncbi:hypothetical protein HMPREF1155_0390 [Slackia sp. CM382]|uniref:Uncharacterized protein n=1 Tax=Slackia exigua (strain ATCC 700122 / DSM 15923 / CIP 105133 / JCM 11022 / KCTC 5966 / S-7) TaxID=649764 RepID=D0WFX6_SLAES|nr:hypothetical protein HMPREF0762_00726 [Slackia exigua ATCC 700122]EJU34814.1 hypothetical protein HMPREF1155_0390 [Slackia sp. CM382]
MIQFAGRRHAFGPFFVAEPFSGFVRIERAVKAARAAYPIGIPAPWTPEGAHACV